MPKLNAPHQVNADRFRDAGLHPYGWLQTHKSVRWHVAADVAGKAPGSFLTIVFEDKEGQEVYLKVSLPSSKPNCVDETKHGYAEIQGRQVDGQDLYTLCLRNVSAKIFDGESDKSVVPEWQTNVLLFGANEFLRGSTVAAFEALTARYWFPRDFNDKRTTDVRRDVLFPPRFITERDELRSIGNPQNGRPGTLTLDTKLTLWLDSVSLRGQLAEIDDESFPAQMDMVLKPRGMNPSEIPQETLESSSTSSSENRRGSTISPPSAEAAHVVTNSEPTVVDLTMDNDVVSNPSDGTDNPNNSSDCPLIVSDGRKKGKYPEHLNFGPLTDDVLSVGEAVSSVFKNVIYVRATDLPKYYGALFGYPRGAALKWEQAERVFASVQLLSDTSTENGTMFLIENYDDISWIRLAPYWIKTHPELDCAARVYESKAPLERSKALVHQWTNVSSFALIQMYVMSFGDRLDWGTVAALRLLPPAEDVMSEPQSDSDEDDDGSPRVRPDVSVPANVNGKEPSTDLAVAMNDVHPSPKLSYYFGQIASPSDGPSPPVQENSNELTPPSNPENESDPDNLAFERESTIGPSDDEDLEMSFAKESIGEDDCSTISGGSDAESDTENGEQESRQAARGSDVDMFEETEDETVAEETEEETVIFDFRVRHPLPIPRWILSEAARHAKSPLEVTPEPSSTSSASTSTNTAANSTVELVPNSALGQNAGTGASEGADTSIPPTATATTPDSAAYERQIEDAAVDASTSAKTSDAHEQRVPLEIGNQISSGMTTPSLAHPQAAAAAESRVAHLSQSAPTDLPAAEVPGPQPHQGGTNHVLELLRQAAAMSPEQINMTTDLVRALLEKRVEIKASPVAAAAAVCKVELASGPQPPRRQQTVGKEEESRASKHPL
ncbi:hypothetical protein HK104_007767 [Borealophlyctis nickersoniae]|nr:hypothetical protein HK104_007767 [Borealophlyctis nickersoniae]